MKIEMTWDVNLVEPPLHGPPVPHACPEGWESHVWTLTIEGIDGIHLHTDECNICDRGFNEMDDWQDFAGGEFKVRVSTRTETYGQHDRRVYFIDLTLDEQSQSE